VYLLIAHGAQGIVYVLFAAHVFSTVKAGTLIPVTITVPTGRPGLNTTEYVVEELFYGNPLAMVSTFFFITALFHGIRAWVHKTILFFDNASGSPSGFLPINTDDDSYGADDVSEAGSSRPGSMGGGSRRRSNPMASRAGVMSFMKVPGGGKDKSYSLQDVFDRRDTDRGWRWLEYSITSTIMIWIIGLESGITDLYALGAIGLANVGMILMGAAGDKAKDVGGRWRAFFYGSLLGFFTWVIIFAQVGIIGARAGASAIPFVFAITFTLFALFFSFSVVELMYIRTFDAAKPDLSLETETWRERYEFGYQLLSAVSKTTLGALVAAAALT
jgi:hypothetical protein